MRRCTLAQMGGESVLGYLMATAWLGLLVYIPVLGVRRAGSFGAWLRECGRDPVGSSASVLIGAGCCGFLLWLLTGGMVPVKLALLAPAGLVVMVLRRCAGRTGAKRDNR